MSDTTDKTIRQLLDKLNLKNKEIQKAEKPQWQTHLTFGYDPDSAKRINLATITNITDIIEMLSFLLVREEAFNKASEILGVKENFKWLGYTIEQWTSDFKTRISIINISSKKKEYKVLEEKLNQLISPEERRRLEIEEISKLLE